MNTRIVSGSATRSCRVQSDSVNLVFDVTSFICEHCACSKPRDSCLMAEGAKRSRDLSTVIDEAAASLGYARLKEQKKALRVFVSGRDVLVCVSPNGIWQVVVLRSAANYF